MKESNWHGKKMSSNLYQIKQERTYFYRESLWFIFPVGIQSDIPLLLRKLFNALNCISPNSVESERAFSITGQFATKLCIKLDDDTLSSLVFLKAFYKNEAPN